MYCCYIKYFFTVTECVAGFYGTSCSSQCGQCLNDPCNHVDGSCTGGCEAGYTGDKCDQRKYSYSYDFSKGKQKFLLIAVSTQT